MNGKGDKPRNCFSEEFKNNYDLINWNSTKRKNKKCQKKMLQKMKK